MMRRSTFPLLLLITIFCFAPGATKAADRCERLEEQLDAEQPPFDYRRWIAAFEDLRHAEMGAFNKKEIQPPEYYARLTKTSDTLDCLDNEIHLKSSRSHYQRGLKLAKAGCRKGDLGKLRLQSEANTLRVHEERNPKACRGVDTELLAQLWKKLEVVKAEKAATEERETRRSSRPMPA